jgi:predicted nucleotidyltransferase
LFSALDTLRYARYITVMKTASVSLPEIQENVLRDPRHPVHKIADQLRPYLRVLVEQFHPERVILFGSYAYGVPTADSDVDLLVVKAIEKSPVSEATRIRRALRHLRHTVSNLPLDIMVRTPEDLRARIAHGADFHEEIVRKGLVLI